MIAVLDGVARLPGAGARRLGAGKILMLIAVVLR